MEKYAKMYWPLLKGHFMKLPDLSTPQRYGLSFLPTDEGSIFVNKYDPYDGFF